MGNEALTLPESASLRLQQHHLSLSHPSSLSLLIFHSSSPALVFSHYLLWPCPPPRLLVYQRSIHHHFFLPRLCHLSSCFYFNRMASYCLSLPMSFFLSPYLPCFLTIITAQFVVSAIKSASRLQFVCIYLFSVCPSPWSKKACSVQRHRRDSAGLTAHSPQIPHRFVCVRVGGSVCLIHLEVTPRPGCWRSAPMCSFACRKKRSSSGDSGRSSWFVSFVSCSVQVSRSCRGWERTKWINVWNVISLLTWMNFRAEKLKHPDRTQKSWRGGQRGRGMKQRHNSLHANVLKTAGS